MSSFTKFFDKNNTASIYCRNLPVFATEICKSIHQHSLNVIQEKFKITKGRYDLQRNTILQSKLKRSQKYGIEPLIYLAQKDYSLVPKGIDNSFSLNSLIIKSQIGEPRIALVNSARHIRIWKFEDKTFKDFILSIVLLLFSNEDSPFILLIHHWKM